jgi:endonuclease III
LIELHPVKVLQLMRKRIGEFGSPAPMDSSSDAFPVLVSTIISLRTRDKVTREVSKRLLGEASDPRALVSMPREELEDLLKPAGFYRQKAGQLKAISRILIDEHDGEVPDEMDELLALPGVGRKTANFVLGMVFGKPAICVDVHVHRISNRLGLVDTGDPEETEMELRRLYPEREWTGINHVMVRFGQRICRPVGRLCTECPFMEACPSSNEHGR